MGGDDRKREAENRAFVRLVGKLDREGVGLLLRLAQAMQSEGRNESDRAEIDETIRAIGEAVRRAEDGDSTGEPGET
jgi:hypothetical protein